MLHCDLIRKTDARLMAYFSGQPG